MHTKDDEGVENHHETLPEMVEASVKGQDEPMERNHPTAPGALVWFTYPVALIIMLLVALAVMAYLWNPDIIHFRD